MRREVSSAERTGFRAPATRLLVPSPLGGSRGVKPSSLTRAGGNSAGSGGSVAVVLGDFVVGEWADVLLHETQPSVDGALHRRAGHRQREQSRAAMHRVSSVHMSALSSQPHPTAAGSIISTDRRHQQCCARSVTRSGTCRAAPLPLRCTRRAKGGGTRDAAEGQYAREGAIAGSGPCTGAMRVEVSRSE